jgi:hypothetical protein
MSEQGKRVYRAGIHFDYRGANVFCWFGHVSPCGEWVDFGVDQRGRLTADWHDTEAAAKASKAAEVAAMGAKLLEEAQQLLAAAKEVAA